LPPPGYNIDEVSDMRQPYLDRVERLWTAPPEERTHEPGGGIKQFFFIALSNQAFYGVRSEDQQRARELLPVFTEIGRGFPGTIGFIQQSSLFQSARDSGRVIDIEISGTDLNGLIALSGQVLGERWRYCPRRRSGRCRAWIWATRRSASRPTGCAPPKQA
jgi:hydrophobic/amphiphilic exporter-1 (mainly G- bacteria), HAE1 family